MVSYRFSHQSIPARRQVHPPDPRGAEILKAVARFGDLQQRHLRWQKTRFGGVSSHDFMGFNDFNGIFMGFSWDFNHQQWGSHDLM